MLGDIIDTPLIAFAAGDAGKIDPKDSSFPVLAFHFDTARMFFNNGVTHGEAQSRSLVLRLGRKKGIE